MVVGLETGKTVKFNRYIQYTNGTNVKFYFFLVFKIKSIYTSFLAKSFLFIAFKSRFTKTFLNNKLNLL